MTLSSYRKSGVLARVCVALVVLVCVPAWCQKGSDGEEPKNDSAQEAQLSVPPPVNGQAYSTAFVGESKSNYLRAGVSFSTAYSNNINGGDPAISSMSYSIWPTIALDRVTYRSHLLLNYSAGFTFYQKESAINEGDQNLGLNFQYKLSPYLTASIQESFQRTSNIFNQPSPLSEISVSGALPTTGVAIIAPALDQQSNTTSVQLTYQTSESGMLGGSGSFTGLQYLNPTQASNLSNSQSAAGSVFYSSRLRDRYYVGASYQYQNFLSYGSGAPSTRTETDTIFFFLTAYLKPTLSISISAGPQHYNSMQAPLPTVASWQPMTMASLSWRGERTTVAASYARTVGGGGGLNGTFNSNNAGVSVSWRATRNWTAAASGGYSNYQTLTPLFVGTNPGGHSLLGTATVQRTINDRLQLGLGYNWTHQNYSGIPAVSNAPNVNRVFVTLTFHVDRPL
jgi:hypothetical protein